MAAAGFLPTACGTDAKSVGCTKWITTVACFAVWDLNLLSDMGIDKRELLIGVHPGAAYGETKRWFPERFGAVLGRLQKSGRRFLLLGGPGEELIAQQISMIMDRPPIDLVGKTTVAEALALVSMCALFLSNDSGLMHVAAALRL
jgi:heptosyltransferase-2